MNELLLLSIKTKHANKIFNGTKVYEFRKKSICSKNINKKVFIYSSEKDKKIIGYIIIDKILEGNIDYILKETNNVDNESLKEYFSISNTCYALHIKKYKKLLKEISLEEIRKFDEHFNVPQFYRYIKKDDYLYKILNKDNIN